ACRGPSPTRYECSSPPRRTVTGRPGRHRTPTRPTPTCGRAGTSGASCPNGWRGRTELAHALEVVGEDPFLHAGLAAVSWQYVNAGISGDMRYLAEAEKHARKVLELDPAGAQGPRL